MFQGIVDLSDTAPIGRYWVNLSTARSGYESAQATSAFFVAPPLTMTLDVAPNPLARWESLMLTARVYDRGTTVTQAGVWAEITTPDGAVTVPLVYGSEVYTASFRPIDLGPNLGGSVRGGQWQIAATVDYYGSTATAVSAVTVFQQVYLPLVLRGH